ncbi:MAG: type II toxin-antitoxin system ParD family antitoxin [Planctomycetota bacterium]
MNVALPETLKDYVLQQVAEGTYGSVSEYVRDLIWADQKRKSEEKLESLLLEGLQSGPARELTPDDRAELRRRVWERHQAEGEK